MRSLRIRPARIRPSRIQRLAGVPNLAIWLVAAGLLTLVALSSYGQSGSVQAFVVIVKADNPATTVDSDRLSKMFLKKIKRWDEGATVLAFDQLESTEVREAFTRSVHGKSISAIKSYWQRMIFSGRDVPPEELDSDAEVMSAVAEADGGIGYVSPSAELTSSVKALRVTDK